MQGDCNAVRVAVALMLRIRRALNEIRKSLLAKDIKNFWKFFEKKFKKIFIPTFSNFGESTAPVPPAFREERTSLVLRKKVRLGAVEENKGLTNHPCYDIINAEVKVVPIMR